MFGIFRSRTSAYYFSQDLKHGGAAYIPTGRGYALKHATFVKTYTSYGRSHIYYAVTVRRRSLCAASRTAPSDPSCALCASLSRRPSPRCALVRSSRLLLDQGSV